MNPEVVERLTTLMKKYIEDGRSTAGERQKNEFPISLNDSSVRSKKRKEKKTPPNQ